MKMDRSFIQEIHNQGAKTIVQTLNYSLKI